MPSPFDGLITDESIDRLSQKEGLIFDAKRRELLKNMDHMDVQACPGSGKTTLIAAKLILLAERWPFKRQGVCVLSHTNVAKNEIIERIKKSNSSAALSLLSYPHFIGTIQEFVNRFMALPYIRQEVQFGSFLEGNEGYRDVVYSGVNLDGLCRSLYHKCGGASYDDIKSYLGSLFWLNADMDMAFYGQFGALVTYNNDPSKVIYPQLRALKKAIINKGSFQYRDMYAYADKLIDESNSAIDAMRLRFPLALLDEMQDTQKYQDDLLRKVFPLGGEITTVQRFGDADQAIFHGINNEEPNESYNGKAPEELEVINKSHRFDNSIGSIIKGLSFNEVSLTSELGQEALEIRRGVQAFSGEFEHTIFIYGDGKEDLVIQAFADHVASQFEETYKKSDRFSVKVVGAVGKDIDDKNQLRIGHYWEHFKKDKSKSSFNEASLYEAVIHCSKLSDVDWSGRYKLLRSCFLRMLRLAGKKDAEGNYFNASSMKEFLEGNKEWKKFRGISYILIKDGAKINHAQWEKLIGYLLEMLGIDDVPDELASYIEFSGEVTDQTGDDEDSYGGSIKPHTGNTLIHNDGFKLELSTIHAVKGETHDATLVLETKYYNFDMEVMLPYLTGDLPDQDNLNSSINENPSRAKKPNRKFMRQLYVAMSRPKYLLCLAMRKSDLGEEGVFQANKTKLESLGWRIVVIDRV